MLDKMTILSAENINNFTSNKDCLLLAAHRSGVMNPAELSALISKSQAH